MASRCFRGLEIYKIRWQPSVGLPAERKCIHVSYGVSFLYPGACNILDQMENVRRDLLDFVSRCWSDQVRRDVYRGLTDLPSSPVEVRRYAADFEALFALAIVGAPVAENLPIQAGCLQSDRIGIARERSR